MKTPVVETTNLRKIYPVLGKAERKNALKNSWKWWALRYE
jgi:hypothetical protein